jgi:epoxyqueuosine reductase
MRHLAEHVEERRRLDVDGILVGARSVVCLGVRYARADEASDGPIARSVARYARGRDYHRFVKKRLHRLARFVESLGDGVRARALCDIEPVLERAWAARSGLGFVGKNGLVITPGQGSYQLLGEVVTTLALAPGERMTERCGSCTRCLDACPTAAFVAPFVLDPRRCISYLTIEAKGLPPGDLRAGVGEHLFGCDVCQEVCPFNAGASVAIAGDAASPFAPSAAMRERSLAGLVALDPAAWDAATLGTPLRRTKHEGVARNAVIVAWNRLDADAGDRDALAVLAAAEGHPSALVRAAAASARADLRRRAGSGDTRGSPPRKAEDR